MIKEQIQIIIDPYTINFRENQQLSHITASLKSLMEFILYSSMYYNNYLFFRYISISVPIPSLNVIGIKQKSLVASS